jgi:hypothetical protein
VLGVVGLNPQLAVDDIHMRQRVVNALVVVPAERHQNEAAAGAIKDRFACQIAVSVGNLRVPVQNLFDRVGVIGHGSHRTLSFFFTWKTTTRRS